MEYPKLFERVRRHLESFDIPSAFECGDPVKNDTIATAEKTMGIRLPTDLTNFYQTIGDGCSLAWIADPDDKNSPLANLEIPSLENLSGNYLGWRKLFLYTPEEAEEYGFPYTDDPALAKHTAARMWHWLPIINDNSNEFCIDLSEASCPVVFNKGDWMDGGTGDNGQRVAANFGTFMEEWSQVFFQFPKSLYWPDCFLPGGGMNWNTDEFRIPTFDDT